MKIATNFFKNTYTSKRGAILNFIEIWKNLPNKLNKIKNNNRSSFQFKLNLFINKTI